MDIVDLCTLDVTSLETLYHKNLAQLHDKLLTGATWMETSDLRNFVTELEKMIDTKRRFPDSVYNPDYKARSSNI